MNKVFLFLIFLAAFDIAAATIKIGVLVPEGTGWAKNIKKMTTEIKEATKGNINFKVYYGGSQGDEQDVLRKIRIGQLQGGIFTGKTLGEINGDVRVVELPFNFNHDEEKALKTMQSMAPFFNKKFEQNKFKNLATFGIGQVYFVTQKKIHDLNSIKSLKIWLWDGDPIVATLFESMKLVGVPLALPDVLSSLSTGIVESAYAPPIGIVALQWSTKVKYIVDFPISYSIGAFVITDQAWLKMSPVDQKIVQEVSKKYEGEINIGNKKDNVDSLAAMNAQKIEFVKFSDTDIKTAQGFRQEVVRKLRGKLFSEEALKKLEIELAKK